MVNLVEQGWASQQEVARAFACAARTVRRHQRRLEEGGLAALGRTGGYPRGRARLAVARERLVQSLKARGVGQREIARRMGVNEKAIRNLLRRLGWKAASPVQNQLPLEATPPANPNLSGSMPAAPSSRWPRTQGADSNLSAFCGASKESFRRQPRYRSGRPLRRPLAGAFGFVGGCASALWLRHGGAARRSAPGLAGPGRQRRVRVRAKNLRQPWPGLLWVAHQLAHAPAHGALAHQTPGGSQGVFAPRLGTRAGVGPGAGSQNAAAQTGASGGRRTGRPVRPGPGPTTGRVARSGSGFPLHRRPCAGLSRAPHLAQSPCGPHAHFAAGHFGLLGQR